MSRNKKIIISILSLFILFLIISAIGLGVLFVNKNSSNNENNTVEPPIINPNPNPIPPNNIINFETWNNQQNKENLFSTVAPNGKLNIVLDRGADDIKNASFADGRINDDPILGNIINDQYKRLAQISFSVNFAFSGANYLGTAWILDYEIPKGINQLDNGNTYTNSNYPTKWFLATNTHVMDDLKTPYSIYKETNTSNKISSSTTSVILNRIKNPQLGTDNGLYKRSSYSNPAYENFWFRMTDDNYRPLPTQPIRPVFLGFDYLYSSPDQFINNVPQPTFIPSDVTFDKVEEMADFSVFEIDFEKVDMSAFANFNSPNELAMHFSSNYANWKESDKFKPASNSLLVDYNTNSINDYYALGFPQEAANGGPRETGNVLLYANRPNSLPLDQYNNGSKLVLERFYNTFKNARGIFDLSIGSPDFSYKFNAISNTVTSAGIIPYLYQGLSYTDQNGDMKAGSSGSIFVDQYNNIYGIHFASDFTAHVGINFALRCEGYNYDGAYGLYNLQPYDLINGGYDNQKQSYKSQLNKLFPNGIRTNIFKKGINH